MKFFCLLFEINWRLFLVWEVFGWFEVILRRFFNDKKRVERKVRVDYLILNKIFKLSDYGVMVGIFFFFCRGCGVCNIFYLGCCCDIIFCMFLCFELCYI